MSNFDYKNRKFFENEDILIRPLDESDYEK